MRDSARKGLFSNNATSNYLALFYPTESSSLILFNRPTKYHSILKISSRYIIYGTLSPTDGNDTEVDDNKANFTQRDLQRNLQRDERIEPNYAE